MNMQPGSKASLITQLSAEAVITFIFYFPVGSFGAERRCVAWGFHFQCTHEANPSLQVPSVAFSTEEQDLHPNSKLKLWRCAVIDARWVGSSTNKICLNSSMALS